METFRTMLLEVWREASQHSDIQETTRNITRMLAKQLPLAAVIVRRLEPNHSQLVTVAASAAGSYRLPAPHSLVLSTGQWKRLQTWGRQIDVAGRTQEEASVEDKLLLPPGIGDDADVLLASLIVKEHLAGVLLLIALPGKHFDKNHMRLVESLREPISVTLENDHRLHELEGLREAAEADRRSLLTRLGRRELGETVVGADSGLKPVMERVQMVAPSDVPVLILGETGTGKEVIARAIHTRSSRGAAPFIRVNCGAIPHELIDSQLFGHEKGSFTGAGEMRQGWFERADGGTLFLDEIGELPLPAQVRLLRVLQDGYLERVGGQQPIRVDVRIVAATHRDLASMVRTKEFREDLWYRLAVFPILLPPLRERKDDIRDLAEHFAERAATRFGLAAVPPTSEHIAILTHYDWPGNIRELGAVIDRAAILGGGKTLEISTALGVIEPRPSLAVQSVSEQAVRPSTNGELCTLDQAIRNHIELALHRTHGRIEGRKGAAALLHINPHTLRAKMRKLKMDWKKFRE